MQRFMTLVKQSQELKTVSYHKLYDILKQHQNEVNKIRAERLACTANPLALVAQQQPVYHLKTILIKLTLNILHTDHYILPKQRKRNLLPLPALIMISTCYGYEMEEMVKGKADWKDDTDDESDDQELEPHYMYMAQIQEVTPDPVDNSRPIFDDGAMH
ncbi:hypothetical protein Tco_0561557 [Tanacetum coccineum]